MSETRVGRWRQLSPARRAIAEILHQAQHVPTVPVAKRIQVAEIAKLRQAEDSPPSWTALFMWAYAQVAREFPALRRIWMPWPVPHLYEHPYSVCKLAIERHWENELVPFLAEIHYPEDKSLSTIQEKIQYLKHEEIQAVGCFRQMLRLGSLSQPLRRIAAWKMLYLSGSRRARRVGTFGLSNYGQLGAESIHPIAPLTTVLTLGPIGPKGDVTVKVIYDHRVLDGSYVARCLNRLEHVLLTSVADGLRSTTNRTWQSEPTKSRWAKWTSATCVVLPPF